MTVHPFEIKVPQTALADLQARLARTRWPNETGGPGWDDGTNLAYMRELVAYWQDAFDWQEQEERLNRFAHFRAVVDGVGIHFVHEGGKGPNPLPLVLTHGWPGTFAEFLDILPLLTDPASHGGTRPTPSTWSSRRCQASASPTVRGVPPCPDASPSCGCG